MGASSLVPWKGGFLVVGGRLAPNETSCNDLHFFDPSTREWSQLAADAGAECKNGGACAVFGSRLVALSGTSDGLRWFDLSAPGGEWQEARAEGGPPANICEWFGGASLNGRLYAVSGYTRDRNTYASLEVWSLDPSSMRWTHMETSGRRPPGRSTNEGVVAMGGELYIFGGESIDGSGYLADVWSLRPSADGARGRWTEHGHSSRGRPSPRFYHSTAAHR